MKQALLLVFILFNLSFADKSQTQATFSSYHGGKRYDFEVTAEQLAKCPAWLDDQENPPLPARRALAIATNYLSTLFSDAEKWEMHGFSLIPVGEKWVYLIPNGAFSPNTIKVNESASTDCLPYDDIW